MKNYRVFCKDALSQFKTIEYPTLQNICIHAIRKLLINQPKMLHLYLASPIPPSVKESIEIGLERVVNNRSAIINFGHATSTRAII